MDRIERLRAQVAAADAEQGEKLDRLTADLEQAQSAIQQALDRGDANGYFEAVKTVRSLESELAAVDYGAMPASADIVESFTADRDELLGELDKAAAELVKARERYKAYCDKIARTVSALTALSAQYGALLSACGHTDRLPPVHAPTPCWRYIRTIPARYEMGLRGLQAAPDPIKCKEDVFIR